MSGLLESVLAEALKNSRHRTADGALHDIDALVASQADRKMSAMQVAELKPFLQEKRWIGKKPMAIIDAMRDSSFRGWSGGKGGGHHKRLRRILKDVFLGIEPNPLVIGSDGDLWDGRNRLFIYALIRRPFCKVLDFRGSVMERSSSPDFLPAVVAEGWIHTPVHVDGYGVSHNVRDLVKSKAPRMQKVVRISDMERHLVTIYWKKDRPMSTARSVVDRIRMGGTASLARLQIPRACRQADKRRVPVLGREANKGPDHRS